MWESVDEWATPPSVGWIQSPNLARSSSGGFTNPHCVTAAAVHVIRFDICAPMNNLNELTEHSYIHVKSCNLRRYCRLYTELCHITVCTYYHSTKDLCWHQTCTDRLWSYLDKAVWFCLQITSISSIKRELNEVAFWRVRVWMIIVALVCIIIAVIIISVSVCSGKLCTLGNIMLNMHVFTNLYE